MSRLGLGEADSVLEVLRMRFSLVRSCEPPEFCERSGGLTINFKFKPELETLNLKLRLSPINIRRQAGEVNGVFALITCPRKIGAANERLAKSAMYTALRSKPPYQSGDKSAHSKSVARHIGYNTLSRIETEIRFQPALFP